MVFEVIPYCCFYSLLQRDFYRLELVTVTLSSFWPNMCLVPISFYSLWLIPEVGSTWSNSYCIKIQFWHMTLSHWTSVKLSIYPTASIPICQVRPLPYKARQEKTTRLQDEKLESMIYSIKFVLKTKLKLPNAGFHLVTQRACYCELISDIPTTDLLDCSANVEDGYKWHICPFFLWNSVMYLGSRSQRSAGKSQLYFQPIWRPTVHSVLWPKLAFECRKFWNVHSYIYNMR